MVNSKEFPILSVQVLGQNGEMKKQVWDTQQEIKLANPCGAKVRWNNGVEVWREEALEYTPLEQDRLNSNGWKLQWTNTSGIGSEILFTSPTYAKPIQFLESDGDVRYTDSIVLFAFSGMNEFLIEDAQFKNKYVAKKQNKNIFQIERQTSDWKIIAKVSGVSFKSVDSQIFNLNPGVSFNVDGNTLVNGSIIFESNDVESIHWWRFKAFQKNHTGSIFLPDDEMTDEDFTDKKRTRNTFFAGIVLSLAGFSLFLSLRPQIKLYTENLMDALEPIEIRLQKVKQKSAQLDGSKKENVAQNEMEEPVVKAKREEDVQTPVVEVFSKANDLAPEVAPVPEPELIPPPVIQAEAPPAEAVKEQIVPITPVIVKKIEALNIPVKENKVPPVEQQKIAAEVKKAEVAKLSKVINDPSARLIAQNKETLQATFSNLLTQAPEAPVQNKVAKKIVKRNIASEVPQPTFKEEKITISEKLPVATQVSAADFKLRTIASKHAEVKKEEVIDSQQGRSLVELNKSDLDLDDSNGGILSRSAVEVVIRSHLTKIRSCHETALMDNDELDGIVTVDFTVSIDGSVKDSKVKNSSVHDKGLERCILRVVNLWRFPKPQGGTVSVTYPFTFKTLGGSDE